MKLLAKACGVVINDFSVNNNYYCGNAMLRGSWAPLEPVLERLGPHFCLVCCTATMYRLHVHFTMYTAHGKYTIKAES